MTNRAWIAPLLIGAVLTSAGTAHAAQRDAPARYVVRPADGGRVMLDVDRGRLAPARGDAAGRLREQPRCQLVFELGIALTEATWRCGRAGSTSRVEDPTRSGIRSPGGGATERSGRGAAHLPGP